MALDPRQDEERARAAAEVAARLRQRGIALTGAERPDDLVDLLSAVERFEAVVEAHGGDLMVDDLKSSQPDDRHFVVPRRGHGETVRAYVARIDEAAARLRGHPRKPD
jgi:broad specificity phosphatase PhoE